MLDLMAYLPSYYKSSLVMQQLQNANAIELQAIDDKLTNVLDQFLIGHTDTAIARWENELGVRVDEGKPIEQRRSILMAKIRGAGTTTIELIETTALAYSNGNVEVIEDAANNTITIKFISVIGLPPNAEDFQNSISEIIPAHLLVVYEYKFNTHSDLSVYTNTKLALHTHGQIRESDLSAV